MKHLLMLCSNDSLKHLFLSNMFSTICKINKDLEQILEQGKYPNKKKLSLLTSRSKNYIYIYILYTITKNICSYHCFRVLNG